ncbi:hypothetical protein ES319_D08G098800v1 [Gossypium barbadense]|uniref:Uncharacterized protein n=3 Tax=Gossypium TaxID=3633 RepID=A0A5J5QBK7_GOSBA|nr:hypothetical protein ES319_D08G098800v1 [Gossypium barbadense]KAB2016465.1 hypothetical protein ES319_D08G098800v1 [Gossypium barbadense]KAB2016466.1 hypothetical protein ES319_D08G098800v1 [Gossypium barbadense]TYG56953.1 hypothetical protein ES288_D08G104800v1 [Gossypium darwinii]TYG56954.1 hypothetical protein ES288_D08G104800v1 [Gossypium darwinii]
MHVAEKTSLLRPIELRLVPVALEGSAFRSKFLDTDELMSYGSWFESLLRGRFLHERPVEEERQPSVAVSELNQLSHYSEVKYPLAFYFIRMCYSSLTMSNLSL